MAQLDWDMRSKYDTTEINYGSPLQRPAHLKRQCQRAAVDSRASLCHGVTDYVRAMCSFWLGSDQDAITHDPSTEPMANNSGSPRTSGPANNYDEATALALDAQATSMSRVRRAARTYPELPIHDAKVMMLAAISSGSPF